MKANCGIDHAHPSAPLHSGRATRSAKQYNPKIKAFYERLVETGKPKMVALIASMRKLLTILNTMIKEGKTWNKNLKTT